MKASLVTECSQRGPLIAGDSSEHSESRVALALEEYAAAIEAGEPLGKETLLAKYADVAAELAGCLDSLDFIRQVAPQLGDVAADSRNKAGTAIRPLATLGDYRIIRELGRGGMGVVYEAEQLSLGRRVALKVLPFAAMLGDQQLKRFHNEARAAATLNHPNIVAIYSVGTERGVHYYAMQLVEGSNLAQVIAELRNTQEGALKSIRERESADAFRTDDSPTIAHPGPHIQRSTAQTGRRAWSTDTAPVAALSTESVTGSREFFQAVARLGIQAAEALDYAHNQGIIHRDVKPANLLVDAGEKLWVTDFGLARIEADAGVTMTGDLLGTLRYMSPEQALANRVVVDQRTDVYSLGATLYELLTGRPAFTENNRSELLKQIAFDEPHRPRKVDHRIPADLETIVLKAMEKRPEARYQTAGRLADDLRAFLENRPIKAKPPTMLERTVKWGRRHKPLVVSAVTSATALLLVSLGVLAASNVAITRERNEKASALQRAQSNFEMVLAVINRSLESVGDQTLADVPQLDSLRRNLLDDAVRFYDQVLQDNPNDPTVRFAVARAQVRAADIHQRFLNWQEAIRLNESAMGTLHELLTEAPGNVTYRSELATALKQRSWNAMAIPSTPKEDADRARRSVELFQGLYDGFPQDANYQASLLEALLTLDEWSTSTAEREQLLARMLPLAANPKMKKRLQGETKDRVAIIHVQHRRLDEAEAAYRDAIRLHREGVDEHPTDAMARTHLVREYNRLGNLLFKRNKVDEAVECFGDSFQVGLSLRRDFPAMKHFDEFTLEALLRLVNGLQRLGRTDEAAATLAKWELLSFADCMNRGLVYFDLGQFDNAVDDFTAAIGRSPGQPESALMWRGRTHYKLREYADALADYQASLDAKPDYWEPLNAMAWLLAAAHDEQLRNGKQAVQAATKACQLTGYKNADSVATLAAAYAETGDFQTAMDWSHKAIELAGENSPQAKAFARRLTSYEAGQPWRIAANER